MEKKGMEEAEEENAAEDAAETVMEQMRAWVEEDIESEKLPRR